MKEPLLTTGIASTAAGAGHRSLVRSVAWNAGSDWASQIFSWLAFLIVMRLLVPADFGLAAMAVLLTPYLGQLTSFGIPRTVVTLRDLTPDQLGQLNTVSFAFGLTLFGLVTILAKYFALFMKAPRLTPVVIVACTGLVSQGLQGVSTGLLMKQMRFKFLSIVGVATNLLAAVVTLAMAFLGFRYWALIGGNLIAGILRTILILHAQPCRLKWPHLNTIKEPLKFGWHVMVSMLALTSYQRLDNLVAGRTLGQIALGFYGMAWELANVPIEKVTSLVTTVIPSYMAAVQDQPVALRRYLRTLTEAISLLTFPATVGLALVAPEFVPLFFGVKWVGMVPPLEILSFYAAVRSIAALLPKVLTAVGEVSYVMWNDLAALVILPVAFYIGSERGTAGIAWGWVIAYPVIVLPLYRKTLSTIAMTSSEYVRALWPALEGTVVMIVSVELVKRYTLTMHSSILRLAVEVFAGALAYMVTIRIRHADRLSVLTNAVRRLLPQRRGNEAIQDVS
jgi:teichuronic acid exporter